MEGPVLRLVLEMFRSRLEDGVGGRLWDNDEADGAEEESHDCCEPFCPAPAEGGLGDEAANDGAKDGTNKSAMYISYCKDIRGRE